ncbi:MAG: 16S rRNA (cytosine(1402)-N(4))-methyltransferase RsmH [Pirellula sp.]|nr:16S rRNA (cytosine(1402)-N(4))-methyltransferase RsmH [Pirellula sp.]
MSNQTVHVPVLLEEVTKAIAESGAPGERVWIDGTLGGAGHASELVALLHDGDCLIGFDRDPVAIARSEAKLSQISRICSVKLVNSSYRDIPEYIRDGSIGHADAILLDLGLSSDQLEDRERGFSFKVGGPLDLRFDPSQGISAADLLAKASDRELADIIYQFGEERFSRRIARAIVERRLTDPVTTAEQLCDLIHRVVPGKIHGRIDSATRTFQALRIAVNQELDHLTESMKRLPECLKPGGVLVVISFHSLEDRIVKHSMRDHPLLEVLTRKPILPTEMEIDKNPRSRSAKLRIARRLFE